MKNMTVLGSIFLVCMLIAFTVGCQQLQHDNGKQAFLTQESIMPEADANQWYESVRWQPADAVKALLERGADPDQIFHSGETALHLAIEQGNQELAELLLAYGADVNAQERKEGFTPLMYAAIRDDRKMMRFLVRNGADPTATDADGFTTYHYLAYRGNRAAMQLLAGTAPVPDGLPTHEGLTVAEIASLSKRTVRMTLAYAEQR